MVPELSRAELLVHLRDQLDFLDASCSGFDAGHENEAKRLAGHVRIICHQTDNSTSLLRHLGVDGTIEMRDSVPLYMYGVGFPPGSIALGSGLSTVQLSETTASHVPRMARDPLPNAGRPLADWWTLPVIFTMHGQRPSRKQIVLWLANKSGGAHVDQVPSALAHLLDGSAMGIGFALKQAGIEGRVPVLRSPMPAAMRQIAEEVRVTLRDTFADELAEIADEPEERLDERRD